MSVPQYTELLGLSLQQLTEIVESLAESPYRARQLFDGLYRQRWSALERFTTLSQAFRQRLSESGFAVGLPRIEKKFVSADGTVRYLLAFADGQSVETVWMPEGDGGEAGDGSESGDEELEQLDSVASVGPGDSFAPVTASDSFAPVIPSEAEGSAVRRERDIVPPADLKAQDAGSGRPSASPAR